MFKRKLLLLSLVITLCLLFSVFSNAEKVKLTVWAPPYEVKEAFESLVPEFEKLHPDIEVKFIPVPWKEGVEKLTMAVISNTLPDLTFGFKMEIALIKAGVIEPLDAFLTEEMRNDYLRESLEYIKVNGHYYGIPVWADLNVVFFRKDLFKEAGYSSAPKTWSDLIEYAKKLTVDKDGDGEIDQWLYWADCNPSFATPYFDVYLYASGGRYYNPQTLKAEIDSPQAIEALKFYTNQALKYNISAPPEKATKDDVAAFINGTVTCLNEYPWFIGAVRNKAGSEFVNEKMGVALPFVSKEGRKLSVCNLASGHSILITKQAKNKEAAWEFAKYMGSRDVQLKIWDAAGSLPANKEAIQALKDDKFGSVYFKILQLEEEGNIEFGYDLKTEKRAEIISEVTAPMISKVFYGKMSAEEAAKEAAGKINNILSSVK